MIAFVAWFWLTYLWALDREQHFPAAVMLTKYLVVFYMVYRLVDTPAKVRTFLLVHAAGCLYLGWLGLSADASGRLDGVGGPGIDDSNTLGMQLATAVVTTAMLLLRATPAIWLLGAASIALSLNTIVLAGSRGAFLGLAAGGIALALLHPTIVRRKFILYAALGIFSIGAVASQQFWERMNTVKAAADSPDEMDGSARSRLMMAEAQLQMAQLYPFGSGHRGSEALSSLYLDPQWLTKAGGRSSHNVFLTVLVEQGVPGVFLSLVLIAWTSRSLLRIRRASNLAGDLELGLLGAAIGGALSVVLVSGVFADFSKCEVQIWMFALLAVLVEKAHPARVSRLTPGYSSASGLRPALESERAGRAH